MEEEAVITSMHLEVVVVTSVPLERLGTAMGYVH